MLGPPPFRDQDLDRPGLFTPPSGGASLIGHKGLMTDCEMYIDMIDLGCDRCAEVFWDLSNTLEYPIFCLKCDYLRRVSAM